MTGVSRAKSSACCLKLFRWQATAGSLLLKQSIGINKSLFVLRKVIKALASSQRQQLDLIPYRDSTLTRLLKHSLGGSCLTLMIACLCPPDRYADENLSTLNYAALTQRITNRAVVNEDPKTALIRRLRAEASPLLVESQLITRMCRLFFSRTCWRELSKSTLLATKVALLWTGLARTHVQRSNSCRARAARARLWSGRWRGFVIFLARAAGGRAYGRGSRPGTRLERDIADAARRRGRRRRRRAGLEAPRRKVPRHCQNGQGAVRCRVCACAALLSACVFCLVGAGCRQ